MAKTGSDVAFGDYVFVRKYGDKGPYRVVEVHHAIVKIKMNDPNVQYYDYCNKSDIRIAESNCKWDIKEGF